MAKIKINQTGVNFPVGEFKDFYKKECSIELSSMFYPRCIWFGSNSSRMHLSVDDVKKLLPILKRFVETGDIVE